MSVIINFALYQIGWFAIVIGASLDRPWWSLGFGLAAIGLHLACARGRAWHFGLICASGALGLTVDSLQLWLGLFRFPSPMIVHWIAPLWDAVLWMQFATILPFCLSWLSRRYLLCCVFGYFGGPLAFIAGERFGAISFLPPRLLHIGALATIWALAFPLLVWLSDTLVLERGLGGSYRFIGKPGNRSSGVNRYATSKFRWR